jgi:excisionase family DNA binding protein
VAGAGSPGQTDGRFASDRRRTSQPPPAREDATTNGSLLFADDVAAMVGMTRDWIYAETRAGRIPHVTLGRYYRYRPESIDAWLRDIERGNVGARYNAERR